MPKVCRRAAQCQSLYLDHLPACLQGAKPVPFLAAVGLGLALRFLVPVPAGITMQAWTLLSIFISTIAGGAGKCRQLRL